MGKSGLIFQPSGLGDILFLQKITKIYKDRGFSMVHPVLGEYSWLEGLLPHASYIGAISLPGTPDLDFPHKDRWDVHVKSYETEDFCYLNFWQMPLGPIMETKYTMFNIPWDDWADHIEFKRNREKENSLYYNVLGLQDAEPYVFVNYLCQPRHISRRYHRDMGITNDLKQVHLDYIPEYNLFDWFKVIENSRSIYMVESALNCMMESPQLKDIIRAKKELHLFSRHDNFSEVRHLYKLPWNYHT